MEVPGTEYERVVDAATAAASTAELEMLRVYARAALADDPRRPALERLIDARLRLVATAQALVDEVRRFDARF